MAKKSEDSLIAWLAGRLRRAHQGVPIGIGDDMAMLGDGERPAPRGWRPRQASRCRAGAGSSDQSSSEQGRTAPGKAEQKQAGLQQPRLQQAGLEQTSLLVTVDMLMDGVDFEVGVHPPELIGRKALAASLSDCAAMAVRPRCALVSVALPADWPLRQAQRLFRGIENLADEFDCVIVGGDTNSWRHPLVVDVIVIGEPFNGVPPVRRDGMQPGDLICVTGRLGGSLFAPDSENRQASQHSKQASASRARHGLKDGKQPSARNRRCLEDGRQSSASRNRRCLKDGRQTSALCGRRCLEDGGRASTLRSRRCLKDDWRPDPLHARSGRPDCPGCWPHHLVFEPRVREARWLAERLGGDLHAMMDLSDGLSTDAHRMAAASGCGIEFDARALQTVVSPAAVQASRLDRRSPLDHLLNDGEDFELLFAVSPDALTRLAVDCEGASVPSRSASLKSPKSPASPDSGFCRKPATRKPVGSSSRSTRGPEHDAAAPRPCAWTCIGTAVGRHGLWLRDEKQRKKVLRPRGWQHFMETSQS